MAPTQPASDTTERKPDIHRIRSDAAWGIALGILGGLLLGSALNSSLLHAALLGAGFGLVFGSMFSKRASTAGAGLVWGLSSALLCWFLVLAVSMMKIGTHDASIMLNEARGRFPELAAYLLCLGCPTGLALGIRGGRRRDPSELRFRLSRAIMAGGLAGIVSGLIFGHWMLEGGFFPLLAGLGEIHSLALKVLLQFCVAFTIGATFGLLFQRDVHGYGSCMGWGLGYAVFCWFAGPLTLFPLARQMPWNWSVDAASPYFGALVGHILYGLILGVVYATSDRVWVRLFIQSDPLNRESEGPGFRLFRSLQWGAGAGLAGGLISSPFMFVAHVLPTVVGVDTQLSTFGGLLVHLLVSTLIGMSYGILFRDEASNLSMATGWGWVFGLIWWYAGPLTLLPLLLTSEIDWRISAVSTLLPSLLGHLIYGACTAAIFYGLEQAYKNEQMLDPRMAARELRRLRPIGTPAPALWFFAMGMGTIIPLLLR
jgi:uncharacterized membrane protein YagU involved in acid resistance